MLGRCSFFTKKGWAGGRACSCLAQHQVGRQGGRRGTVLGDDLFPRSTPLPPRCPQTQTRPTIPAKTVKPTAATINSRGRSGRVFHLLDFSCAGCIRLFWRTRSTELWSQQEQTWTNLEPCTMRGFGSAGETCHEIWRTDQKASRQFFATVRAHCRGAKETLWSTGSSIFGSAGKLHLFVSSPLSCSQTICASDEKQTVITSSSPSSPPRPSSYSAPNEPTHPEDAGHEIVDDDGNVRISSAKGTCRRSETQVHLSSSWSTRTLGW